jgi:hypothetical protein
MPLRTDLILGFKPAQIESPVNQLAQVMQLQGAQQANQLNALKMDEYNRGVERQNKLRQLMGGLAPDATDEQRVSALRGGSYFDEADKLESGILSRKKTDSEILGKDAESENKVIAVYRDLAAAAKDPASAAEYVKAMHSDPRLKNTAMARVPLEQALSQIGQDPESFNAWKQQFGLGATKFIELNKPTYKDQNLGGTMQTLALPGLGGAATVANSAPITQSENSKAEIKSRESEGAKSRAVQIRGQDLTNARAGEALTFEKTKEANKTGADKASHATEGERKAATLLQRMQSSEAQLEAALKLDPSAAKPALVPQGLNAIGMGTTANALTPENRQKVEAAQLDILDAALTLGTGAAYTKEQLEGYRKSYFPQIGDKPNTIKDKQDRLNNVLTAARIAAGRAAGQVTAPNPSASSGSTGKTVNFGDLK